MTSDVVRPPIEDGRGYAIRHRDLRFLGLTEQRVATWRARAAPLGMTVAQYTRLCEELSRALRRDRIDPSSCDLRIKGSAVEFYSGFHKPMPTTRSDVIDVYRAERHEYPKPERTTEIMRRLERDWITDRSFPSRRPFDALFRLGIAREPSDIDVQLSGDPLVSRCEALLVANGQAPTDERLRHEKYRFVLKELIRSEFGELYRWSLRWADRLERHVNVAVFPSCGPPRQSTPPSSHFRDTDWRVDTGMPAAGRP